jgi:hypothetical protein
LTLWLFGGWEVLERGSEKYARSYKVALRENLMGPYIRCLYVRLALGSRQRRRKMESVLEEMTVTSILEEPFAGTPSPGHDQINHTLADLQLVVKRNRPDWRIALEQMKGVYVIHDPQRRHRIAGAQGSCCPDRVLQRAHLCHDVLRGPTTSTTT